MIITKNDLEKYSGVVGDDMAVAYISSAQERVEKYLRYKLQRKLYKSEIAGTGRRYIRLEAFPVTEIVSIKINNAEENASDFEIKDAYLSFKDGKRFFPDGSIVEVEYYAGYTDADIHEPSDAPELIKTTVLQIAALRQMESEQNIGINSKTFGDSGTRVFLSTRKYDDFLVNISEYRLK